MADLHSFKRDLFQLKGGEKMDVTALTHVKSDVPKEKGSVFIDGKAFADEMAKLKLPSQEKDTLDLAENLSQSLGESEVEEFGDEEESIAFTLINPFLRLQSDIDLLSKGQELKTLHIENNPIDNQVVTGLTQSIPVTQEVTDPTVEVLETDEVITKHSETIVAELTDLSTDEGLLENAKLTESEKKRPAELIVESVITSEPPVESTDTVQIIDKQSLLETEEPVDQIQGKHSETSRENIIEETRFKNDQLTNSDTSLKPDFEPGKDRVTDNTSVTEPVNQSSRSDYSDEAKQMSNQLSSELNLNTLAFERQLDNQTVQAADPAHLSVTKEQSVEIIQDMMMTALTDESGKEVFKSTLTLTPETLGEVKIELTYNQEGLSGKLVFESDETRKWMENQWHQLKEPLETKGLTLNQFDFSVTETNNFAQTDSYSFSQEFDQSQQHASKESQQTVRTKMTVDSEEETILKKPGTSTTGLNIYA